MKRSVLLSILIISLIFIPLIIADEVDDKINNAYTCLENKVAGNCNSLSSEEKIFSLLAIEECKDEVISNSANNECWPSSGCNLKTTAQAVLALDNVGFDLTNATTWLLSQNTIPLGIEWYLEIESTEATTCTIVYSDNSYSINIGADKKINTGAGNCLSLSEVPYEDYFLEVDSSCYNKEFEISCDQSFLTTLLYKKSDSPIIYVSDKTSSASASGTTTEKVDFSCFKQGNTCNYEGSLWAAFVLNYLDEDISSYKPYLVTMAEDNLQYIPEAFLYLIEPSDTNFRTILLSKQQSSKWWSASGDKYYDTALALLPFQDENPIEKTNSKNWLLDVQDSEGCWQGNIRNTAFILYSIWPEYFVSSAVCGDGIIEGTEECDDGNIVSGDGCSSTCQIESESEAICGDGIIEGTEECESSNLNNTNCTDLGYTGGNLSCYAPGTTNECMFNTSECIGDTSGILDCDDIGGYCIFETSCSDIGGSELSAYSFSCSGTKICCDTSPSSQTCSEIGGEICDSDETCSIATIETFDTYDCCTGSCEKVISQSECESEGGTCRDSCLSGEEENSNECGYIGEVCCVDKAATTEGIEEDKNYWWIWILLILIVLVVIGIIFRDKLRPFWLRIKSKFKKKPKTPPRYPLTRTPLRRPVHRMISPSRRPLPSRPAPATKLSPATRPKSELDDVLKKLKEIGK